MLSQARHLKHVVVAGSPSPGRSASTSGSARRPSRLEAVDTSKDDAAFWLYSSGSTGGRRAPCTSSTTWSYCADTYALQVLGMTRERPDGLGGQALLRLRPRQQHVLPAARGRAGRALPASAAAGGHVRADPSPPARPSSSACRRSTPRCSRSRRRRSGTTSPRCACASPPARRCRRSSTGAGESASASRSSTASARPRSCTSSSRTGRARRGRARPGSPVPGYEARHRRRRGTARAAGRDRQPAGQGRLDHGVLLEPAREDEGRRSSAHWIQTGDKYYQDADGYFWYCGRADDMLKVGGIWVSPVEVENTLIGHAAVLEAAVVGPRGHGRARQAEGLRRAEGRIRRRRPRSRTSSRPSSRTRSRRTSTRAGSSSSPSCRRPRPGRSSASSSEHDGVLRSGSGDARPRGAAPASMGQAREPGPGSLPRESVHHAEVARGRRASRPRTSGAGRTSPACPLTPKPSWSTTRPRIRPSAPT